MPTFPREAPGFVRVCVHWWVFYVRQTPNGSCTVTHRTTLTLNVKLALTLSQVFSQVLLLVVINDEWATKTMFTATKTTDIIVTSTLFDFCFLLFEASSWVKRNRRETPLNFLTFIFVQADLFLVTQEVLFLNKTICMCPTQSRCSLPCVQNCFDFKQSATNISLWLLKYEFKNIYLYVIILLNRSLIVGEF